MRVIRCLLQLSRLIPLEITHLWARISPAHEEIWVFECIVGGAERARRVAPAHAHQELVAAFFIPVDRVRHPTAGDTVPTR